MEKPEQRFRIGQFAKVHGLLKDTQLNDRYVEIETDLKLKDVPDTDGENRKTAWRYGVSLVTEPEVTGYIEPENLMPTDGNRRSIWIHETGTEGPQEH